MYICSLVEAGGDSMGTEIRTLASTNIRARKLESTLHIVYLPTITLRVRPIEILPGA